MNILKRNSSTINIATFWENHQLSKYDFDPPYQRPSEVWGDIKQSFLIDTILKNFPMPPIFLHQHIDESTGKTMYDVIDGKQRLGAIIAFIDNKIATPDDFDADTFGADALAGIYFNELDRKELSEWKKIFWRYELTIEYIDTDQLNVVNAIFDRLNRNGEPLTRQELRNARFHSTPLYNLIKELADLDSFSPFFEKIQKNRLEHHEITSELLFSLIEGQVLTGDNQNLIDSYYEKTLQSADFNNNIDVIKANFVNITNYFSAFHINYRENKVEGLSHLYALWHLAYILNLKGIDPSAYSEALNEFYRRFVRKDFTEEIRIYKLSMSSNTKSRSSRTKRITALLRYLGLDNNIKL